MSAGLASSCFAQATLTLARSAAVGPAGSERERGSGCWSCCFTMSAAFTPSLSSRDAELCFAKLTRHHDRSVPGLMRRQTASTSPKRVSKNSSRVSSHSAGWSSGMPPTHTVFRSSVSWYRVRASWARNSARLNLPSRSVSDARKIAAAAVGSTPASTSSSSATVPSPLTSRRAKACSTLSPSCTSSCTRLWLVFSFGSGSGSGSSCGCGSGSGCGCRCCCRSAMVESCEPPPIGTRSHAQKLLERGQLFLDPNPSQSRI